MLYVLETKTYTFKNVLCSYDLFALHLILLRHAVHLMSFVGASLDAYINDVGGFK